MKLAKITQLCDIPRPYSRSNCKKDLISLDEAVQSIVQPKNLRSRSRLQMEMRTTADDEFNRKSVILSRNKLHRHKCLKQILTDEFNTNNQIKVAEPRQQMNPQLISMKLASIKNPKLSMEQSKYANGQALEEADLKPKLKERLKITNKFKSTALQLAYNTFNKKSIIDRKKKHKFVIYVKGFNKTQKRDKSPNGKELKDVIQTKKIEPINSLHDRIATINAQSRDLLIAEIQKSKENLSNLNRKNREECTKISIMVSKLGDPKSRNHIHDVYSISKNDKSQPQLLIRKSRKVAMAQQELQPNRLQCNKGLKSEIRNSQKEIAVNRKQSKNRQFLPDISSRGCSEVSQRQFC